jgi:phospholipase C
MSPWVSRAPDGGLVPGLVAFAVVALVVASTFTVHSGIPPPCTVLDRGLIEVRSPIHHVFFLIKENHAFENYFGDFPGAVGYPPNGSFPAEYGSDVRVHPFPLGGTSTPELPHDHASYLADLDGGLDDDFVAQAAADGFPAPSDAVGYYTAAQLPGYYAYAHNYLLDDEFFAGVLGPTTPNRLLDLGLTEINWTSFQAPPPRVVSSPTILNQLESAGIPWNYYYSNLSSATEGYVAPLQVPSIAGNPCMVRGLLPMDDLRSSLAGPNAPAVGFLDPSDDPTYSEHPPENVTLGEEWSVAAINEIFESPIGASSAIFVFFDEPGGFWDPVTPPVQSPLGDSFRVPLLVLSPWTPHGVLSGLRLDPAGLLKFVDANWGMPYLTPRIAAASALSGFFDFNSTARSPLILPTNVTA